MKLLFAIFSPFLLLMSLGLAEEIYTGPLPEAPPVSAMTYGGVTLSNVVTGTTSPSLIFTMGQDKPVVTIRPDGSVKLADGTSLDEASKSFWSAVQSMGMKLACEQK